MDWIWVWVAVIAVSLLVEIATLEMVSVWSAIGGVGALILAACNVVFDIQLIVFFAISIILLLSFRKLALKYLLKNNNAKIGTDSIIGSTHKLTSEITNDDNGTVKINGVTWTAVNITDEALPVGTKVEILEIRGNKLIVKKGE